MVARTGRAKGGKGKGLPNGGAGGTGGAGGAGGAAVPAPEPAADQVDAAECKFKHLLEPIRDLAINWNIDIAQELENYLGQLEQVQVSLDGGVSLLNFAEAALLIQGSTCVYSRKVEYLHRLVLQVLDVIDHKLSKELRKDAAAQGEHDAEEEFPADPEFISLDDIPEAKSSAIDMVEKSDPRDEADDLSGAPMVVMMNMEVDNDNPDPNKDLRLSTAMMHESGALLLDPCSASQLDANLMPRKSLGMSGIANSSFSPERIRSDQSPSANNVLAGMDMEHADGGADKGLSPPQVEPDVGYGGDDSDGDAGDFNAPDLDEMPSEGDSLGGKGVGGPAAVAGEEEEDLWRVLDPHDGSAHAVRPLKKGRTVRRPPAQSKSAEAAMSIDLWAKQTRSLKAPSLPEFSEVFLQERNRLLKLRLAAAKARGGGRSSNGSKSAGGMVVSRIMQLLDVEEDDYELPSAGAYEGGGMDGGDDMSDDGGGDMDAGDFGGEGEGDGDEVVYGAGTPRKSLGLGLSGASSRGQQWDDLTYEDLCKQHIEKYLRGVDDMLHRSALESRVRDWRKKIEPALEAEEARKPFNIHEYGEQVKELEAHAPKKETDEKFAFDVAVKGCTRYDVCRTFLATLQLANDGNVEIALEDPHDNSSIRLRLMSQDSKHKEMVSSYMAPSVASARKKRVKTNKTPHDDQISPVPAGDADEDTPLAPGALTQASQLPTQETPDEASDVVAAEATNSSSAASKGPPAKGGRRGRPPKANKENVGAQ